MYDSLIEDLAQRNYSIVTRFLPESECEMLRCELGALYQHGAFRPARIGKETEALRAIRGDQIAWFEAADLAPGQSIYWNKIDELKRQLNRELLVGINDFELHFARYPIGSHYLRHTDCLKGESSRVISTVLYLNPAWDKNSGGELRLYPDAADSLRFVDVSPQSGTLVCFRSDQIEHEVLATNQVRLSVTGWLHRRKVSVL